MNNGCLCITCTCTGCHEECFGHCNACGDPTTDCNSYQTDGEKYSSFSSKNDNTQPKNEVKTKAATSESIKEVLAVRVKQNGWEPVKKENQCQKETASLAANTNKAFDYSRLDVVTVDTLHLAEKIIRTARQKYIVDLAGAVEMAHEELVRNSDGHNQYSEDTFIAWCRFMGISKTTAYQLLQVQALISGSSPEEQTVLESLSPSLLYAAAKPSAPVELVQGVKDGDITTHKQYQEAMAQLKAAQQAQANAEQKLADEQRRRQQSDEECVAAQNQVQHYKEMKDAAIETLKGERDAAAQKIKRQAEIIAMRERELAEESDRADAAEQRVTELESRPVEVAVQEPDPVEVKRLANEKAAEMTAMYKAQINTLKEQMDDAERRAQYGQDSTYMAAAEFAEQAAATIHGIRTAFWTLAKELSEEDFLLALEPLDNAVKRIYGREWEDEQYLEDEE